MTYFYLLEQSCTLDAIALCESLWIIDIGDKVC